MRCALALRTAEWRVRGPPVLHAESRPAGAQVAPGAHVGFQLACPQASPRVPCAGLACAPGARVGPRGPWARVACTPVATLPAPQSRRAVSFAAHVCGDRYAQAVLRTANGARASRAPPRTTGGKGGSKSVRPEKLQQPCAHPTTEQDPYYTLSGCYWKHVAPVHPRHDAWWRRSTPLR